ncbi:MAG TPA: M28 family peptidase [Myxococcales bacterium]|jgi:subtilisin-like proprotein convertase family protein|nr:M28 family peptidase [Myxococcales bacterium]
MRLDPQARPVTAQLPATCSSTSSSTPAASQRCAPAEGKDAFVGPGQVTPDPITASATPNAPVKDLQTTTSTIHLDGNAAVDKLKLDLDITHTYRGDLVVTLTSPSGKSAVVSNRAGGSADNIKGSFDLSAFAGEPVAGDWKLSVQDAARVDEGTLNSWGLTIQPKSDQPPPPPPVKDDSDPMKHIEYFASDALKGRNSPSEGLDAASKYAQDLMKKYGLQGPNTGAANPYEQAYDLFSFQGQGEQPGVTHNAKNWGLKQFEHGFYLDKNMSKDDLKVLSQRYRDCQPPGVAPVKDFSSVDEVRAVAQQDGKTRNTLGMLQGTGPHKDEVIVLMAHLDHLGVDRNGNVYNGADDNASGSSVLLSMLPQLQQMQKEGKLDRSVMVVLTGGEEKGLVGSSYLANHPVPGVPNSKIAGVINADMVGRWDDQRLSVIDTDSRGQANYFRDIVNNANAKLADPFDRVNRDINQYRDRQDGAIWTRKNIPTLFLFEGLSNPNGGGDLIDEYHQPEDDVDLIYRDSNGNKPRHVRDLMLGVVDMAANRSTTTQPRQQRSRVAEESRGVVAWQ